MRYCIKCGARLPEDESAQFCPICGTSLATQMPYERSWETSRETRRGLRVATLRNRILVLLVALVFCLAITAVGTLSKVESIEAHEIVGEVSKLEEVFNDIGLQLIFGNNLMYCMIMFVPVYGPYYGTMVLYSTGRVLAALGVTSGANPLGLFLTLFIFPHAWLEYISYSLAISESFWIIYAIIKNRGIGLRSELSTAAKIMAICAVLLLLAAFTEMYIITSR